MKCYILVSLKSALILLGPATSLSQHALHRLSAKTVVKMGQHCIYPQSKVSAKDAGHETHCCHFQLAHGWAWACIAFANKDQGRCGCGFGENEMPPRCLVDFQLSWWLGDFLPNLSSRIIPATLFKQRAKLCKTMQSCANGVSPLCGWRWPQLQSRLAMSRLGRSISCPADGWNLKMRP